MSWQVNTLHIGAKRTAPSHELGCFRCIFKATAPPIDCPNKKLGRPQNSDFLLRKKASKWSTDNASNRQAGNTSTKLGGEGEHSK